MVIFYKKWKKYNEIQLTKKQNGLKYPKNDKSSTLPRYKCTKENSVRDGDTGPSTSNSLSTKQIQGHTCIVVQVAAAGYRDTRIVQVAAAWYTDTHCSGSCCMIQGHSHCSSSCCLIQGHTRIVQVAAAWYRATRIVQVAAARYRDTHALFK